MTQASQIQTPPLGTVQRQITLPMGKALEIAYKNIRMRLARSLLVTSGIVLVLIACLGFLVDLPPDRQLLFLEDMAVLGRAVAAVCGRRDPEFRRINLEIQGNTDAFLHAHVTPRYGWEPEDIVGWPAALHHWTGRTGGEKHVLGPQHEELRAELVDELDRQVERPTGRPS